jgi:hypothetical protein
VKFCPFFKFFVVRRKLPFFCQNCSVPCLFLPFWNPGRSTIYLDGSRCFFQGLWWNTFLRVAAVSVALLLILVMIIPCSIHKYVEATSNSTNNNANIREKNRLPQFSYNRFNSVHNKVIDSLLTIPPAPIGEINLILFHGKWAEYDSTKTHQFTV